MQNNSTYKQKKASGKYKKRAVSDEYLAEVLKKLDARSQKEKHKQALMAGKEFVLLCMLMNSAGWGIEEIPAGVASLLKDYPEALKEALAFYEDNRQKPELAKKMIQGIIPFLDNGQLKIRFLWKTIDPGKLDTLKQELAGE